MIELTNIEEYLKRQNLTPTQKYCITHRQEIRDRSTEWRQKNPNYKREWWNKLRFRILNHYSNGTPHCFCCNETTLGFLTIDHVEGKKANGHDTTHTGSKLYEWIVRNNFPSGFQVLCMNCNHAKGRFGKCPHEEMRQWR